MKILNKIIVGVLSFMLLGTVLFADTTVTVITIKNKSDHGVIIKGELSGHKGKVVVFGGMPNSKEVSKEFQEEFNEIRLKMVPVNCLDSKEIKVLDYKEFKVHAVLDKNKEWQFADSSDFFHTQKGDHLTITVINKRHAEVV
jgi:hypothetical protein